MNFKRFGQLVILMGVIGFCYGPIQYNTNVWGNSSDIPARREHAKGIMIFWGVVAFIGLAVTVSAKPTGSGNEIGSGISASTKDVATKFCGSCGSSLALDSAFCSKCGKKIG
ncbi:MAG: hypothetical protein HZA78_03815 [Candidatus Schekmanbacteria bacterium]|nr:hypothetical protein [Candidatus Schekmanbacteria bacterium]